MPAEERRGFSHVETVGVPGVKAGVTAGVKAGVMAGQPQIREVRVSPRGGTLVVFDSVSVLETNPNPKPSPNPSPSPSPSPSPNPSPNPSPVPRPNPSPNPDPNSDPNQVSVPHAVLETVAGSRRVT